MPVFDFKCRSCDVVFEKMQRIPTPNCPGCGLHKDVRRVFTAPGIVFKGSGWAGKS